NGPALYDTGFIGFHQVGFSFVVGFQRMCRMVFGSGFFWTVWFFFGFGCFLRTWFGFSSDRMLSLDLVWFFFGSGFLGFFSGFGFDSGFRVGLRFSGLFRLDIFVALTIQRCSAFLPFNNLFDKAKQTFDFQG